MRVTVRPPLLDDQDVRDGDLSSGHAHSPVSPAHPHPAFRSQLASSQYPRFTGESPEIAKLLVEQHKAATIESADAENFVENYTTPAQHRLVCLMDADLVIPQEQREALRLISYEELLLVYGMYRWKRKTARNQYLLRHVGFELRHVLHRIDFWVIETETELAQQYSDTRRHLMDGRFYTWKRHMERNRHNTYTPRSSAVALLSVSFLVIYIRGR